MLCTWGWGWGGAITFKFMSTWTLAHIRHASLWDLFPCVCTHVLCYALGPFLALTRIRHATLWVLLLHLHTYVMLRSGIFSCTCTHTYVMLACHALSCYIYIDIFTLPLEVQLSNRCTSTYQTFANHGVLETTNGTNNLLLNKTILKLHTSVSCSCSNDMPHLMHS